MEEKCCNHSSMHLMKVLVGGMVFVALGSYAILNFEKIKYADPMPPTISVTGVGEVKAVPDVGRFSFSVTAEGPTAEEAQKASGTKINDILAYLKEAGVEEKDVKTDYYNLYPHYRYDTPECGAGAMVCPPGEQVQDGFEVTQAIMVKVRDTNKSSEIITEVGKRGATNLSGLEFVVDDTDALRAQAQAEAVADARAKAEALARELGVDLVRVFSYYEDSGDNYYAEPMMSYEAKSDVAFGGPELPPGESTTKVQVNVTYVVK